MKTPLWLAAVLLASPLFAQVPAPAKNPDAHPCQDKPDDFNWGADKAYESAFTAIEARFKKLPDDVQILAQSGADIGGKCAGAPNQKSFEDCGAVADHVLLSITDRINPSSDKPNVWMINDAISVTSVKGQSVMKEICKARAGRVEGRKEALAKRNAEATIEAQQAAQKKIQDGDTARTLQMANDVLNRSYDFNGGRPTVKPAATPVANLQPVSHSNGKCASDDCNCLCQNYRSKCNPAGEWGDIMCTQATTEAATCLGSNQCP